MFLCFFGYSQKNTIVWKADQKLEWSFFAGVAQSGSHHHALTASGVSIDMQQSSDDSVSITIEANFYPKKSWLKNRKGSDHLLNHEQRHFDIAEIYRRRLVKSIYTSDLLKSKNITKDLDDMYMANDKALRKYQNKYDDETKHSQRKGRQEEWNELIDNQLAELEEYNTHVIKLPVALFITKSTSTTTSTKSRKKKRRKKKRE